MKARTVESNISVTISALSLCLPVLQMFSKLSKQLREKKYHPALKTLEQLEQQHLPRIANYRYIVHTNSSFFSTLLFFFNFFRFLSLHLFCLIFLFYLLLFSPIPFHTFTFSICLPFFLFLTYYLFSSPNHILFYSRFVIIYTGYIIYRLIYICILYLQSPFVHLSITTYCLFI